jgi:hypothetical protein
MVTADDEQPTNEVELPGKPVASAAGAEATMIDLAMDTSPDDESVTNPLGRRPHPDVLFAPPAAAYQVPPPYQVPASPYQVPPPHHGQAPQPPFGPDDATRPQAPQAAQGYGAFPSAAPVSPRKRRRPAPLIALVSALGIISIAAAAFFFWPTGDHRTVAQRASAPPRASATVAPSASAGAPRAPGSTASAPAGSAPAAAGPTSGSTPGSGSTAPSNAVSPSGPAVPQAPAPVPQPNQTSAPISGTTTTGVGVSYQTVEVSSGYFEGVLTITNKTGRPMPSWTVSFSYPGSSITNVWGGVLVRSGSQVVIRNDATTAPVPVGSSIKVRFGGSGTASKPVTCLLAGEPCGF